MKHFVWGLFTVAAVAGFAGQAAATPLTNTSVIVSSSFDGGPTEQMTLNFGSDTNIGNPEFVSTGSDGFSWMHAGDYIDFYGNNDGTNDFAYFDIGFANTDSFQSTDTIHLEYEAVPGYVFNPATTAIVQRQDLAIPSSLLSGNTLSFDMTNLDQIGGPFNNPGLASWMSKTAPAPVPEPATLTLVGLGLAGAVRRRLRRTA